MGSTTSGPVRMRARGRYRQCLVGCMRFERFLLLEGRLAQRGYVVPRLANHWCRRRKMLQRPALSGRGKRVLRW